MRLFILLIFLLALMASSAKAQWTTVGSAGFSSGTADFTSLAFDSNDTVYVVYRDYTQSFKATVMKNNGTSWDTVGNQGFTSDAASYTSIAFDSNDTPYVAYTDGANSNKATVVKYNGSSWIAVGSIGFTSGAATYITMAFDSNDNPCIAYRDDNNGYKATVMKYNGSSWDTVGNTAFSSGTVQSPKIQIGTNDTIYVAFSDASNSDKLTVMKYNGSSWVTVGSAGFTAGFSIYDRYAFGIDADGTPYVAFIDFSNSGKATAMKYNGSAWVTVGSPAFSPTNAIVYDMAFDNNNLPYIVYRNPNDNKATVMKFNGTSWQVVGTSGFTTDAVAFCSLVIDSKNEAHIVFQDANSSNKATVMKYEIATWNGSTWTKTPSAAVDAFISSSTAPSTFTCKDITINNGVTLNTGTSNVLTIHGNFANNGNGVTGQGTLTFTASDTVEIAGDTIEHEGTVIVESGCTLTTNSLLRLTSDASNTGRIGQSDGTISGNVMVQRYMPGKRCFRFYGHPFSSSIALSQLTDEIDITGNGGSTNGFTNTTTNNPSAFWFDVSVADTSTTGANPGWTAFTSANSADWDRYELLRLMVRGAKGEGLSGGAYTPSAATFEGTGSVNQGTQVITLTKGSNTEFVGVGNPFPSPVEMDKVTVGTNVGANYYAWDATSGASGAYVSNAWTLPYDLPAYAAFFTTVSANSNNTLTFEEADKVATSASLFKTTAPSNWVELYIYDSSTKWDRLLINLDDNSMAVQDKMDGKKLYNPNLDFFTLSKDDVRLAVDVRPYDDGQSIPLGLTAYNRYNRYVIKTGMFDIPAGTKLILHDKYLNTKNELKAGFEYWFDVTADSLSQGNNRFEINMVGKPSGIIEAKQTAQMYLAPNPAHNEVKVSFAQLDGEAQVQLISITGQVMYRQNVPAQTGSVTIRLHNLPNGIYIVEVQGENARFTEKMIKE